MATTPTELPPLPSSPGQNEPTPTELPPEMPDTDYPDTGPAFQPGIDPASPTDARPNDTGMTGDFA